MLRYYYYIGIRQRFSNYTTIATSNRSLYPDPPTFLSYPLIPRNDSRVQLISAFALLPLLAPLAIADLSVYRFEQRDVPKEIHIRCRWRSLLLDFNGIHLLLYAHFFSPLPSPRLNNLDSILYSSLTIFVFTRRLVNPSRRFFEDCRATHKWSSLETIKNVMDFFQTFKEELDEIGLSIVDAYAFVQYLNEVKEGYISSLSFFFLRKILFFANIKIHGIYKKMCTSI